MSKRSLSSKKAQILPTTWIVQIISHKIWKNNLMYGSLFLYKIYIDLQELKELCPLKMLEIVKVFHYQYGQYLDRLG